MSIRRPDGDRTATLAEETNRKAFAAVKRHAASADELCTFLHMLGIKQVGGRKVLHEPASTALARRTDGSGRLAPHAHRAAKPANAAL